MSRGVRASGYRSGRPVATRRQWSKLAVALAVTALIVASAALYEAASQPGQQPGLTCSEVFHPAGGGQPFPVFFRCWRGGTRP